MPTRSPSPGHPLRRAPAAAAVLAAVLAAGAASAQSPPPAQPAASAQPAAPAQPTAPAPPPPPPGYGAPPPGYGAPPPGYGAPPPGYGAPPPGYYPYPPPPGYYPPPPYAYGPPPPPSGPREIDYEEGAAIPKNYHLETKTRRGLVIAGAATFGAMYLISVFVASIADAANADEFTPLFIPVAGPFVTLGTADHEGSGTFFLVLDGVAQAGGLAMFIAGLAFPRKVLVRDDVGGRHIELAPVPLGKGGLGLGLQGTL